MQHKRHSDIDPRVLAQAAEWFALFRSGQVHQSETAEWQAWLVEHPDHQAAWARVEFHIDRFKSLPPKTALAALTAPDLQRRRAIKNLVLLGVVGLSSWQFSRGGYWREWTADYHVVQGEIQTITLADGSTVILDSGSALNVEFGMDLRRLHLISGEIYIETAKDNAAKQRPFVVDTLDGRVRALGTRFSVSQQTDFSQVAVFADTVEIQPSNPSAPKHLLHGGQEARFASHRVESIQPIQLDRPAWSQGVIEADNIPLSEFLLQLNRYRKGYLTCAPEIADMRIIGSFPLKDTDKILASLEASLPIKITNPLPLWVKVLPR
ncbi:FecR domain-containing protein [Methylomonas methanica]|uniref:Anti-FecI sigma factor, FecR n=1 Tax=Methylomonas methanica (strain DSM 25384 / MC09) TaxID=857087 RepID=F9ZZ87_METMM|nr:FecR domain-containing protein [Methylomonas methanica]AEG01113.1 anti-FecI sigma factor, FecR [Methylomonas methanica MC09]